MKHLSILMAMFLVVGCQTTQSAETETKPEVVKEVQKVPKEKELPKEESKVPDNPFAEQDIPPNQVVTSNKPVICGRIDTILKKMEVRFGEVPIMMGRVAAQLPTGAPTQVMTTLTYNAKTGSYTFLEQMPNEKRLMCILSTGNGKLLDKSLGTSL